MEGGGISAGNKPGAIRKPSGGINIPVQTLTPNLLRLRDGLSLGRFNELDVHPLSVGVRQIFAIG